MENKLTDNEIKKALECCTIKEMDCENCPNKDQGMSCIYKTMELALDLINRLEAEVEKLKQNLEEAHVDIREHLTEIERMREISEALDIEHEAIKNCAVKEFAEIVKANKHKLFNYIYSSRGFDEQIDNFVKEMVVRNNAETEKS